MFNLPKGKNTNKLNSLYCVAQVSNLYKSQVKDNFRNFINETS